MQIIANEISNLTDARYFAAMGVDWIQYNLDASSTSAINPTMINGIKAWVEGPQSVVHFGLESPESIIELANTLDVQAISLPMLYPIADLEQLQSFTIFQHFVVSERAPIGFSDWIEERSSLVNHIHIDLSINKFSWNNLENKTDAISLNDIKEIQNKSSCFLSLWESDTVELNKIQEELPKIGLVLKGGAEEKVGFKSYDELDEIFEWLEN